MITNVSGAGTGSDFLSASFQERFGGNPVIFRAPGRVNLIGEHTDYNDGFVMPAAIGLYTQVAAAKRADRILQAYSHRFDETVSFSLEALAGPPRNHWSDFIRGVAAILQAAGHVVSGASLLVHGDVPLGAGLSSSASLELSTALALSTLSGISVPRLELVKHCQTAEHQYVGTRCGIMDQFIAAFGVAGHALLLDCRSLDYRLLPLPHEVRVVVCNSMVRHELASGEYNRRRADCETGVRLLQSVVPSLRALRDVNIADLEAHKQVLPEMVYRRCRHVVTENQRTLASAEALYAGDAGRFGQLMYESHASLRDDYEVSCKELDLLVELASASRGVFGSRMTGGGFGGCTVTLIRADCVAEFGLHLERAYRDAMGKTPDIYVCEPAQGAEALPGTTQS